MSDTPRTDAEASPYSQGPDGRRCIRIDFARTLERELTAAKEEIERLRAVLERAAECGLRDEIHAALKEPK